MLQNQNSQNTEGYIKNIIENNFPFPIHDLEVTFKYKRGKHLVFNVNWEWSRHNVEYNNADIVLDENRIDPNKYSEQEIASYINELLLQ